MKILNWTSTWILAGTFLVGAMLASVQEHPAFAGFSGGEIRATYAEFDSPIVASIALTRGHNLRDLCNYSCEVRTVQVHADGSVVESVKTISNSCAHGGLAQKQGRPQTVRTKRLQPYQSEKLLSAIRQLKSDARSRGGYATQGGPSECKSPVELKIAVGREGFEGSATAEGLPSTSQKGREASLMWSREVRNALQVLDSR